jgi:hypothetical protein
MARRPNARRGDGRGTEHGPRWEGGTCNAAIRERILFVRVIPTSACTWKERTALVNLWRGARCLALRTALLATLSLCVGANDCQCTSGSPAPNGSSCSQDGDCQDNNCTAGICVGTCTGGTQQGVSSSSCGPGWLCVSYAPGVTGGGGSACVLPCGSSCPRGWGCVAGRCEAGAVTSDAGPGG